MGCVRAEFASARGADVEDDRQQLRHAPIVIAAAFLIVLGIYAACGLVFAIAFALFGVKKIDPHAAHGSWGFRLLIIPGTLALWPLLLKRWSNGTKKPPEENNAHRLARGEPFSR